MLRESPAGAFSTDMPEDVGTLLREQLGVAKERLRDAAMVAVLQVRCRAAASAGRAGLSVCVRHRAR